MTCLTTATLPAQTTGWRGDGTGRFAQATPPTHWAPDADNIVWQCSVGKGYSSPTLTADHLYITVEPAELWCLNRHTGEKQWSKTCGYREALGEKEAARIAAQHRTLADASQAANKAYTELRKAEPESDRLEALKNIRQQAEERRKAFEREFPAEKRGGAGNVAATVVAHNDRVYSVFGSGLVAAFQSDGTRLWMRRLSGPPQGFGHSTSPLIVDDKLIVHIDHLTALSLADGSTLWSTEVRAKFGSPVATSVGRDSVIVTPAGAIVAAADGTILTEKAFFLSNNSPIVNNGIIYAHEAGSVRAFRLPNSLAGPWDLEPLWEASGARDQRMASALFHEGLLYSAGRRGILEVIRANSGRVAYRKRLDIGELFASPTLAGNFVFYGGKDGKMLVLAAGPKYDEVAVNKLERFSTSPVFRDEFLYLRTSKNLYCIARPK